MVKVKVKKGHTPDKGATTVLKLRGPSAGAPSPENFLIFLSENGEFWCILGGASALYVAIGLLHKRVRQKRKEEKEP